MLHNVIAVVGVVATLLVGGMFALLSVYITWTVVRFDGSVWLVIPCGLVVLALVPAVIGVCAIWVRTMRLTFVVSTRGIRSADWRVSYSLEWAEISEVSAGPKNFMGTMPMFITTTNGHRFRASMPAFISMGSRHFTFEDYGGAGMDHSEYTPPMLAAQNGLARYRRGEFGR